MHNVVKRTFLLLFVVVAFLGGTAFLAFEILTNADEWVKKDINPHVSTEVKYQINAVYDRNNTVLAQLETPEDAVNEADKRLIRNKDDEQLRIATLHALGGPYMELGLTGYFTGTPVTDNYDIVNGLYDQAKDNTVKDFYLTIDGKVCKKAYEALDGKKGTVGVYNYKTGEIICMVSTPAFDPNNPPVDQKELEANYPVSTYNKMLSLTYTPGSIFKIITSACAIEFIPDIYSRTFYCDGAHEVEGYDAVVTCNKKSGHGKLTFEQALNCSCNCVFAELSIMLGKDRLTYTAQQLGFTGSYYMDRHLIKSGTFDLSNAVDIDIGWAGVGQYNVRANPCSMMTLMGAIANGGTAVKPYYVQKSVDKYGETVYQAQTETVDTINMSPDMAGKLKKLLRSNVVNYYGDKRFPNLQMCGKTGTAEIGRDDLNNAWFVGFSQREDFPYAVVVMVEETDKSASEIAIPIANEVLQCVLGG